MYIVHSTWWCILIQHISNCFMWKTLNCFGVFLVRQFFRSRNVYSKNQVMSGHCMLLVYQQFNNHCLLLSGAFCFNEWGFKESSFMTSIYHCIMLCNNNRIIHLTEIYLSYTLSNIICVLLYIYHTIHHHVLCTI